MIRPLVLGAAAGLALGAAAHATTVPFLEDFDASVEGWEDAVSDPLFHVAGGGPDGVGDAYASADFSYLGFSNPFGGGPVIFRANDSDDASGDAFVGDWLAAGVEEVSFWVRHDTPVSLPFFIRIATSFNFPALVFENTQLVDPNTWTELVFPIDPNDPLCIEEGASCAAVLVDVGNFQVGTAAPNSLVVDGNVYELDIDKVMVVPEPSGPLQVLAGAVGLLAAAALRSRR